MAIVGQTADLVPADKLLYALRDVTATVDNVSLIAASIMSKKIAGGADAIVLDVKVGDGAFMKTLDDARELARRDDRARPARAAARRLRPDRHGPAARLRRRQRARGPRGGRRPMRGDGPADFTELVLDSVAHLLALSDLGVDEQEGRRRAEAGRRERRRLRRLRALDPCTARRSRRVERFPWRPSCTRCPLRATESSRRSARSRVGVAALHLGAGRRTKEDAIDHAVGIVCLRSAATPSRQASRSPRSTPGRRIGGRAARRGRSSRRLRARRRRTARRVPIVLEVLA